MAVVGVCFHFGLRPCPFPAPLAGVGFRFGFEVSTVNNVGFCTKLIVCQLLAEYEVWRLHYLKAFWGDRILWRFAIKFAQALRLFFPVNKPPLVLQSGC